MAIVYSTSSEGVDWAALKAELASDHFDNGRTPEQMERSFRGSFRCVYTRDGERFIGTARALSDGVCNAYIVDMWTHSAYRRRGIGRRMLEMLCAPLIGQHVYLFTDDQQEFYTACGFAPRGSGMERVIGRWLEGPGR
ncbi:MAG TPA: GNAT family N-acetyltransferase [Casimicrobiaceae bacterium]|nr:GNAT family N-acetyltransferase [Casimicrobiaceae bacterium]